LHLTPLAAPVPIAKIDVAIAGQIDRDRNP
jgi:hypothetical protein